MTPSGIVTALFAGTVGVTGSPRQKCGVAEEVSFGSGPQPSSIYWNCQRRTSAGKATSSIALGCWNNASGVAEEHHHCQDCWDNGSQVAGQQCRWGLAGHVRFRGRCIIIIWVARNDIHNARRRTHITAIFSFFVVRSTTRLLCLGGRAETWLDC